MTLDLALMLLPGLIIGLTVHEFAHAWSASLLGDNFARRQGRVSLNPLRHLSPLGTLAIFLLPIGWGRPVEVNLYNFRNPKRDYLLTSLAGPAANLLIVGLCWLGMYATRHTYSFAEGLPRSLVQLVHHGLALTALINVILATINLLPIPPLDGSKIWPCLIPGLRPTLSKRTTLICVAIFVGLLWTNRLDPVIDFVMAGTSKYMPKTDEARFEQWLDEGIDATDQKDYVAAEAALNRAIALNPHSSLALHWRAWARYELKRYDDALEDIDCAEAIDNDNADIHTLRADILDQLGRHDEAFAEREHASQKNPKISTESLHRNDGTQ
jgi:Zn-dependent protease